MAQTNPVMLGLVDAPRGYRHMIVEPLGPHTVEYHRPHRKPLMHTIFHGKKDIDSHTTKPEGNGRSFIPRKKHDNPVAAAMDLPYIVHAGIQVVRQPPKLPPGLEVQASQVKELHVALKAVAKAQEIEKQRQEAKLALLFDHNIRSELGDYLGPHQTRQFSECSQIEETVRPTLSNVLVADHNLISTTLHKSEWLHTSVPRKDEQSNNAETHSPVLPYDLPKTDMELDPPGIITELIGKGEGILANASRPSETFCTRNVPFMLEVWQRAEGINLQAAVNKRAKEESQRKAEARKRLNNKLNELADPQRSLRPSIARRLLYPADKDTDRTSSSSPENVQRTRMERLTEAPQSPAESTDKTLSRSTVRHLKKLTREGLDQGGAVLSDHDVDEMIRITLTGAEWERSRTISDLQHRIITSAGRPVTGRRIARRPSRGFAPGEWHKAIASAEGGIITSANNNAHLKEQRLVIPSVRECRDEDVTSTTTEGSKNDAETAESIDTDTRHSFSADFNARFLQAMGKPNRKRASGRLVLKTLPDDSLARIVAAADRNPFSLTRFVAMLRRIAKEHPNPTLDTAGKNSLSTSTAVPPIKTITDFLDTPYTTLDRPPAKDTPAYTALYGSLIIALGDEQNRALRFEACRLLILLDSTSRLGRWEGIAFRKVLAEMLQYGIETERAFAAKALASMGQIDAAVLVELRKELGDIDTRKRKEAIDRLAGLDLAYADIVLEVALTDADNTSWRVRQDALELLERWINKLSEQCGGESSQDNQDNSLSANVCSRKTSDATGLTPTTRPTSRNSKMTAGDVQVLENKHQQEEKRQNLIHASIQAILRVMWNDWSVEVRETAACVLARLGEGGTIIEWIAGLLSSADPMRRIDALKSLTRLGVMSPGALHKYLACLQDEFANVRVEACKLACILSLNDRQLINAILDRFNDFDWRVRAYAVKAVGNAKSTEPQIHESLRCSLYHDGHPSVRAEAIHAVHSLGLLSTSKDLQEAVFTLMETDVSPAVRKEAEKAMIAIGLMFPPGGADDSGDQSVIRESVANSLSGKSTAPANVGSRLAAMSMVPYPHLLADRPAADIEVFMRTSLVAEKEQEAVIEQVRGMANKDAVTAEVIQMENGVIDEDEPDVIDDFMPDVGSMHAKVDVGIGEILRKLPGVPLQRSWQKPKARSASGSSNQLPRSEQPR